MTERKWERYGASTGIAFGILLVIAIFAAPSPPHVDASPDTIGAYFTQHRRAVLFAGVVGMLATVAAVLFIAHLRHVYDRVEHGIEGLSTVVYITGIAAVAASLFYGVISTTLAFMAAQGGATGGAVRALWDMGAVGNGATLMFSAAFLAANAVGMIRGEAANAALGWFAAAAAAVSLIGAVGALTVSSYSQGWTVLELLGVLLLAAWDVATGAVMLRNPEVEHLGARRSLVAPAH